MSAEPEPSVPDWSNSEVSKLHDILKVETGGRARNGRIAWVLAVVVLVVSIIAGVAIHGWSDTSSALEERNTAVERLGDDLATLNRQGILQGNVASCARDALAVAFDDALVRDNYVEGRLLRFYQTCEDTDGRRFR